MPQRQALEKLSLADAHWLEEDDHIHLQEAADRCARMAEELEAVRDVIGLDAARANVFRGIDHNVDAPTVLLGQLGHRFGIRHVKRHDFNVFDFA